MTISRRSLLKAGAAAAAAPALSHLSAVEALGASPLGPRCDAQVWWRKAGIIVPTLVGEHIHVEVEHPDPAVIYNGPVTFTVRILTHGLTGTQGIRYLRLQQADAAGQTERVHIDIPAGQLLGDSEATYTVVVDFAKWRAGRSEMRWTANCPANGEGNRMYQSTGYQVAVRQTTPSYRADPYIEARGWYVDHNYATVRWLTPLANVRLGAEVKVRLGPGSGGRATKLAIVSANPHYHTGDPGVELLRASAGGTFAIRIPGNLPPGSRLVGISSDGQLAGVSSIPVVS